ncbi:MAG TPA: hypothetical protein VGH48_14875, partial [Caldimonas sp.]
MTRAFDGARQLAAAQILGTGRLGAATAAAVLIACSSTPTPTTPAAPPPSRAAEAAPASRDDLGAATIERPRAHWVAVRWSELPGWSDDRVGEFWSVFLRSCERPAPAWLDACAKARQATPPQGDA